MDNIQRHIELEQIDGTHIRIVSQLAGRFDFTPRKYISNLSEI